MNITLKNFKHAKFASEETECFSAAVCIDGKPKLIASNDGHGGRNDYQPLPRGRVPTDAEYKAFNEALAAIGAHAKTLPPLPAEPERGITEPLPMDLDLLIGDLVDRELHGRDFDRLIRSKIVFTTGGKIMTLAGNAKLGWKPSNATPADLASIASKFPDAKILNRLPREEGLAEYIKVGSH